MKAAQRTLTVMPSTWVYTLEIDETRTEHRPLDGSQYFMHQGLEGVPYGDYTIDLRCSRCVLALQGMIFNDFERAYRWMRNRYGHDIPPAFVQAQVDCAVELAATYGWIDQPR